jgi:hypothetical protein
MVEAVTGQRPIGYNRNWLRRGPNTLSLLQELGYLYHIDDLSRDEPFIETVNGQDFVVAPYKVRRVRAVCLPASEGVGPRVRIRLAPAVSQLRTGLSSTMVARTLARL